MELTNLEKLLDSESIIKDNLPCPHPTTIYNSISEFGEVEAILGKPYITKANNEVHTSYSSYMFKVELNSKIPKYKDIINTEHIGNLGIIVNIPKNLIKVYAGYEARACLNLCVFNADTIVDNTLTAISVLPRILDSVANKLETKHLSIVDTIQRLVDTEYDLPQFLQRIGQVYLHPRITSKMMADSKLALSNKDYIYYDMPHSDWKIYSSLTDNLKNAPVSKRIDTLLEIEKVFV